MESVFSFAQRPAWTPWNITLYEVNKTLRGPQNVSGRLGVHKKLLLPLEIEPWFLTRQECRIDTIPTQVPCTGTYGIVVTEMKADSLHKFCLEIRTYSYCRPLNQLAMRQRCSRIDTTINASSPHPTTPKCTKDPQINMWEHVLELGRSIGCPRCRFWIYK